MTYAKNVRSLTIKLNITSNDKNPTINMVGTQPKKAQTPTYYRNLCVL